MKKETLTEEWAKYSDLVRVEREKIHERNMYLFPLMSTFKRKFLWWKWEENVYHNYNILFHKKLPERSMEGFMDYLTKGKI